MKQQLFQLVFLGLLAAQVFSEHYELDILTGAKFGDGTKDVFEATLICANGNVKFGALNNNIVWKAYRGRSENYQAATENKMGKVKCVEIKAKDNDMWMVKSITVTAGSEKTYIYNTDGSFLTSDRGDGKDVMQFCKQGDSTYGLEIKTANKNWAGTGVNKMDVGVMLSKRNTKTGGNLQNKFVRGKKDHFILRDLKKFENSKNGMPDCVTLTVRESDAWLIDEITVIQGKNSRVFKNKDNVWLVSNSSKGQSELRICYN